MWNKGTCRVESVAETTYIQRQIQGWPAQFTGNQGGKRALIVEDAAMTIMWMSLSSEV